MHPIPRDHEPPVRYTLRGSAGPTYTVEGLESLAWRGLLTLDTEIAREGSAVFRAVREWEFAEQVCPPKRVLAFKVSETANALVPARAELAVHQPGPTGRHITTLDEIRALLDKDPNNPQAIQLLNDRKEEMILQGITAPQAFARFFRSNQELNHRLTLKVVYRRVSDAVLTHRYAALVGILGMSVFLGGVIVYGDSTERGIAMACSALTNIALGFLGVYAYHLERWLNLNPAKAVLGLIATAYFSTNAIIAAILCGSTNFLCDADFWLLWFKFSFVVS
jgi:hypothetical protein